MRKITEVDVPFKASRMKNVQKIRPSYNEHAKTKGILVRELENWFWDMTENDGQTNEREDNKRC